MGRQPGFFDVEDRLKRLSDLGGQLALQLRFGQRPRFVPILVGRKTGLMPRLTGRTRGQIGG